MPSTITQYRPSKSSFIYIFYFYDLNSDIPDHITDDLNQISNPSGIPIITPPFSHLSHQNPHSSSNNKKDDDHLFLHPSCLANDNYRRIHDTYPIPSNNGTNIQPQIASVCIIYPQLLLKENKFCF